MSDIQLPLFDIPQCAASNEPILVVNSDLDEASLRSYDKPHCWQYDIRHNNLTEDIALSGIKPEIIAAMAVSDFTFRLMRTDEEKEQAIEFIKSSGYLESGDSIILTKGMVMGARGNTNIMKILPVP